MWSEPMNSATDIILQQPSEKEERVRHAGRWNRDEGMKVAMFRGEKRETIPRSERHSGVA